MIGYNPSHLNKNETLLEAFHRVEAYLKANPQYQVYQSSATYQEGTQEYALGTIVVPEGSTVGKGDVVLFSNVYYAVITSVSETTFSIATATNFRGTDGTDGTDGVTPNIAVSATIDNSEGTPSVEVTKSGTNENPSFAFDFHNIKGATGATGAPGPTGATGATPNITMTANVDGGTGVPSVDVFKGNTLEQPHYTFNFHNLKGEPGTPGPTGENGKDGSNGKNGNATYLCSAQLTQNTAAISKNTITTFPGRPIIENDIIISTAITTFGAMSQVIGQDENTVTVNFIGTLKSDGGSGGTTLNKYTLTLNGGNNGLSYQEVLHVYRIREKCKGDFKIYPNIGTTETAYSIPVHITSNSSNAYIVLEYATVDSGKNIYRDYYIFGTGGKGYRKYSTSFINDNPTPSTTYFENSSNQKLTIIYYNDTEIT